ncbi:Solute carrier family 13 member 5 [Lamellibrachia satsuma]|nr:Solute carrier family 13 member 5 [Lamellibrachia satsuma]
MYTEHAFMYIELAYMYTDLAYMYIELVYMYIELAYKYNELAYMYIELAYMYTELAYMYTELVYMYFELAYMYIELAYMYIELAYMYIELAYMYIELAYMYTELAYVDDDSVMILIVFILFLIPANTPHTDILTASQSTPDTLLDWDTMQARFPWGFIFVLGGAYALADACAVSGLSLWIGKHFVIDTLPSWAMVMVLSLLTAAFTELASNTAVTTILMPIVGCMAIDLGKNPLYLMLPVAVTTSFSFMFPVSSPPNAIAFATGRLRVIDMVRYNVSTFSLVIRTTK